MPTFHAGGVKAVHRSSTGTTGSWTAISGDVTRVEGLAPEMIQQNLTAGNYKAGESMNPTIYLNDHDDYATVEALNRTRTFIALEFHDGRILKTTEGIYPQAALVPKGERSEGDSEWMLTWNHDADNAWEDIASLT